MASNAAFPATPPDPATASGASLARLYLLRATYLLLFEFAWKAIWLFDYGLPHWFSGQAPPAFAEDFPAILAGVILMPLVIPWGYVFRHYVKRPGARWP